ncbi:MAG TPA: hypothetical protein VK053_04950 [Jiangellaceae bacterium]|nr:hypothetical protein [Jiangellaceae bacterium]
MRTTKTMMATAGALATASMLMLTPVASASTSAEAEAAGGPTHKCYYNPEYHDEVKGWACFQPYGDHMFVADTIWEGYGIQAKWETNYGRTGVCRDVNGTNDGVKDCNYNMREGEKLRFHMQLTDDGKVVDTGGWTSWITI